MKQVYQISGMSCHHCVQRVQKALASHAEVADVRVTQDPPLAILNLKHPVIIQELQSVLDKAGAYKISE
jgi:copper chaperone CopZ